MSTVGILAVIAMGAAVVGFLFLVSPRSIKRLGCNLIVTAERIEFLGREWLYLWRDSGRRARIRTEELTRLYGVAEREVSGLEREV